MEDKLGKDVIDGKIVDWDDLSLDDLKKLKEKYKKREEEILKKIDEELEKDD